MTFKQDARKLAEFLVRTHYDGYLDDDELKEADELVKRTGITGGLSEDGYFEVADGTTYEEMPDIEVEEEE